MRGSNSQNHNQCLEAKCVVFIISAYLRVPALKLKVKSHATVVYNDSNFITMTVEVKH